MDESSGKLSLTGLGQEEVIQSRKQFGSNVEKERDYTLLTSIIKSLFSIFNIIMMTLIAIMLLINQKSDAIFMGTVAGINTLVEIIQEVRAKIIIDRLKKLSLKQAKVLRDSKEQTVPVSDLVIGDVVMLSAGDRVPVDGSVLKSEYVELDESILTGETDYIPKKTGEEVRAGSFVAAGSCIYQVNKLSKNSYIQSITKQVEHSQIKVSPLESDIDDIIKALTYLAIFFICLIIGEGLIQEGQIEEIITNSSVLVTSLVPQGLVLITTMSFAYGAGKIAKWQAIIQKLTAIEVMANTKVICMDKTGTLTKNALEVKNISFMETK